MNNLSNEHLVLINIANEYVGSQWVGNKNELLNKVDWRVIYRLAKQHKLLSMVYKVYGYCLPDSIYSKFKDAYDYYEKYQKVLLQELEDILHNFREKGLNAIAHKGVVFSHYLYEEPYMRYSGDVDILIPTDEMLEADKILRRKGYFQVYYDRVRNCKQMLPYPLFKRNGHHEYCAYVRKRDEIEINLELGCSLHTNAAENMYSFYSHAHAIYIDSHILFAYNLQYAFVAACENVYNNSEYFNGIVGGETTLRDYVDLYVFLYKYGTVLRLENIDLGADHEIILSQIAVVLENIKQLYGKNCVPLNISEYLGNFSDRKGHLKIEWKSSFSFRLFNKTKTYAEFLEYLKTKFYLDDYNSEVIKGNLVEGEDRVYKTITNTKYPYTFNVSINCCGEKLMFDFMFKKETLEYLHDSYIEVRMINPNIKDKNFMTIAKIYMEGINFKYSLYQVDNFLYSTSKYELTQNYERQDINPMAEYSINGDIKVSITFPKEYIRLDASNALCYQIFLFEQMYKQHYYLLSGDDKELFKCNKLYIHK